MKKYIAPTVEILAINAENVIAMSLQPGISTPEGQLSNRADDLDMDWDDED